jgi:hypothetical protein
MFINWKLREVNLKIVYYGPALGGKTTNIQQIHKRVNPEKRSELISVKTHEDRTLYFDFLQLELGKIGGLTPKIHLYTVPGQVYYESSRKLVLRGADGVVFVVDSQASRLKDNIESWENMEEHLEQLKLDGIPIVVQFNKRDLPDSAPVKALVGGMGLNGYKTFESIAIEGEGVFDTLKAIIGGVTATIKKQLAATSRK